MKIMDSHGGRKAGGYGEYRLQNWVYLAQTFNAASYFRRKSIHNALIDSKSKVKEILKEHSDSLNNFSNQCFFVWYIRSS